jgi:hypothetical protein
MVDTETNGAVATGARFSTRSALRETERNDHADSLDAAKAAFRAEYGRAASSAPTRGPTERPARAADANWSAVGTGTRRPSSAYCVAGVPAMLSVARGLPAAVLALVLAGCATAGDKAAARDSWGSCISDGVAALDDGKSDPVSIATGVSPRCAVQYDRLTQIMVSENITQAGEDNARRLMREDEIRLITAAVLSHRAARKQ